MRMSLGGEATADECSENFLGKGLPGVLTSWAGWTQFPPRTAGRALVPGGANWDGLGGKRQIASSGKGAQLHNEGGQRWLRALWSQAFPKHMHQHINRTQKSSLFGQYTKDHTTTTATTRVNNPWQLSQDTCAYGVSVVGSGVSMCNRAEQAEQSRAASASCHRYGSHRQPPLRASP